MSGQIQPETIAFIAGLPPGDILGEFPTQHQQRYASVLRLYFASLAQLLSDWFAGTPSSETPLVKEFPWVDALPLELERDRWLALYAVIYDGWDVLKEGKAWAGLAPQTPGELFRWILECRATGLLLRCKGHSRFSPRAKYECASLMAKQPRGLSEQQQKRLLRLSRTEAPLPEEQRLALLERYTVSLLEGAAKKDSRVRKKLREFKRLNSELTTTALRESHPSKRPKGLQWKDGSYNPLS